MDNVELASVIYITESLLRIFFFMQMKSRGTGTVLIYWLYKIAWDQNSSILLLCHLNIQASPSLSKIVLGYKPFSLHPSQGETGREKDSNAESFKDTCVHVC